MLALLLSSANAAEISLKPVDVTKPASRPRRCGSVIWDIPPFVQPLANQRNINFSSLVADTAVPFNPFLSIPVHIDVQPSPQPLVKSVPQQSSPSNAPAAQIQPQAANESGLYTFIEPEVRKTYGNGFAKKSGDGFMFDAGPHPHAQNHFDGEITYSSLPGTDPLVISMDGIMDRTDFDASLEPNHFFDSSTLNDNFLQVSQQGHGLQIGGNGDNMPDAQGGVRLFAPTDGQHGVIGAGIYQRLGSSGLSLVPGIDTRLVNGQTSSVDCALAADSSLRLTTASNVHGWTTQGFVGWNARAGLGQDSLNVSRQLRSTSLFQTVSLATGKTSGFSWNQGLSQRFGSSDLLVETSNSEISKNSLSQTDISLLSPIGRDLLSIRWLNDNGRDVNTSQQNTELVGVLMMPLAQGGLVTFGDDLLTQSGAADQHETFVNGSWQFEKNCEFQLGVSHDWSTGRDQLNGAIGIWVTPEWEAKLRFAPGPSSSIGQIQPMVFGFQLINRFNLTTFASGTVCGTVLLDGKAPTMPIKMEMDDRTADTDSHGNFRFDHALVGTHEVGFDLLALPATVITDQPERSVDVENGKTALLEFSAQRAGKVTGTVQVNSGALGDTDPSAGLNLVITDKQGHDTTTNFDRSFVLGSLPVGKHMISILKSSLPPGYEVVGPDTQEVTIVSDQPSPVLVFQIQPCQKVDMVNLSQ